MILTGLRVCVLVGLLVCLLWLLLLLVRIYTAIPLIPRLWIYTKFCSQDCGSIKIPLTPRLWIYTSLPLVSKNGLLAVGVSVQKHVGRLFTCKETSKDLPPVSCLHHQSEKRWNQKLNYVEWAIQGAWGNAIRHYVQEGFTTPSWSKMPLSSRVCQDSSSFARNSAKVSSSYLVVVYLWFLSPSLSSVLFHVLQYSAKNWMKVKMIVSYWMRWRRSTETETTGISCQNRSSHSG